MDYAVLGWPEEGLTLRLDYREFSYAGKFVMSNTGKAVARDGNELVGAVAFDADRTDSAVLRVRYVTVRADRRGEGIGPELLAFVANRAADRDFERVRIAVNNPFAYDACYKAGFEHTGETTGIAELVCERAAGALDRAVDGTDGADGAIGEEGTTDPGDRSAETYRTGLVAYRARDLSEAEREFLDRALDRGPPPIVETPA